MPLMTALANQVLDHIHGEAALTMPTIHLALSTTTPTVAGTNITEPSGNGYSRVTTSAATWSAATAGAITNAVAINYPTASGAWGTVTHVVAYNASTAGTPLWFASITPTAIGANVTFQIPAGDADSTLA